MREVRRGDIVVYTTEINDLSIRSYFMVVDILNYAGGKLYEVTSNWGYTTLRTVMPPQEVMFNVSDFPSIEIVKNHIKILKELAT